MIQVCDPPRTRQVRRLSTEEFCQLVRGEVSCVYRPRSEVLRMLTVGEAWGTGGVRGAPGAGCILLPMDADVAAAAALRPLDSLAPCFWLQAGCLGQNQPPVWVPLADRVHIAILLARGYAALESRESPQGTVLALYPV